MRRLDNALPNMRLGLPLSYSGRPITKRLPGMPLPRLYLRLCTRGDEIVQAGRATRSTDHTNPASSRAAAVQTAVVRSPCDIALSDPAVSSGRSRAPPATRAHGCRASSHRSLVDGDRSRRSQRALVDPAVAGHADCATHSSPLLPTSLGAQGTSVPQKVPLAIAVKGPSPHLVSPGRSG